MSSGRKVRYPTRPTFAADFLALSWKKALFLTGALGLVLVVVASSRYPESQSINLSASMDNLSVDSPNTRALEHGETGLLCFDFEVFGKVQRVSMRAYTRRQAKALGIKGWIQNTESKTVKGQACGDLENVTKFKKWLHTNGSPLAKIEKAVFTNEKKVDSNPFEEFTVKAVKLPNGSYWA
ncbi:hypothetical protein AAMO2058_001496400 [Amorphochlora amoebiformis]